MSALEKNVKSLAIEALLGKKAETHFQNIFSTRHLGRTLDFIVHQFGAVFKTSSDSAALEYRLREMLQLGIFFAWQEYQKKARNRAIEIEFGWDTERAIVAIAFFPDEGRASEYKSLLDGSASDSHLVRLLGHLKYLSDGMVIRHDKPSGKVQFCLFVNLNGNNTSAAGSTKFEEIEAPLEESGRGDSRAPAPLFQGELQGFQASEKEEPAPDQKISSEPSSSDQGIMKVMSNPLGLLMNSLKKVKHLASAVSSVNTPDETSPTDQPSEPKIKSENASKELYAMKDEMIRDNVEGAFSTIEREIAAAAPGLSKDEHERICSEIRQSLMKNFSEVVDELLRMQGVKSLAREKHFKETLSKLHERIESLKAERSYNKVTVVQAPAPANTAAPQTAADGTKAQGAQGFGEDVDLNKNEKAFSGLVDRFKAELTKDDSDTVKKEFAQGFMEEMLRDRATLNQSMRDFESQVRKKEHDFKTKQGKLEEKIKRLQGESDQKEVALNKMRDALNKKMQEMVQERAKSIDKTEFERKMEEFRKSLQVAQDKNVRLEERSADFQRKLTEEAKSRVSAQQDASKFKQSAELWQKKAQELEAQLSAKTIEAKNGDAPAKNGAEETKEVSKKAASPASSAGDQQLKHKLDQANKLVRSLKEELARTRKKFDELKLEETNLRVQLSKFQSSKK